MVGTRRRCLTSADRGVLYARRCLEFHPIAVRAEDWGRTLSTFEIDRKRDGTVVDHSRATDVLGEPVSALRYLIDSRDQVNPPLAAGDIVTTGTLTRARPVAPGETWTAELTRAALDGICVRFA